MPPSTAAQAAERARPLRADAQRNRGLILEAAERVLARAGVSVPIDEIAREAGVGVGTLYRHFPTKEALLEAIWLSRLERLIDEARSRSVAGDPGEAFFGFLQHCVGQVSIKRDLADALARAGVDVEAESPARTDLTEAIEALLSRAQEAGAVRRDIGMPELYALVAGTCMVAERQDPNACSPERLMAIVCDGLRAAPGARPV